MVAWLFSVYPAPLVPICPPVELVPLPLMFTTPGPTRVVFPISSSAPPSARVLPTPEVPKFSVPVIFVVPAVAV